MKTITQIKPLFILLILVINGCTRRFDIPEEVEEIGTYELEIKEKTFTPTGKISEESYQTISYVKNRRTSTLPKKKIIFNYDARDSLIEERYFDLVNKPTLVKKVKYQYLNNKKVLSIYNANAVLNRKVATHYNREGLVSRIEDHTFLGNTQNTRTDSIVFDINGRPHLTYTTVENFADSKIVQKLEYDSIGRIVRYIFTELNTQMDTSIMTNHYQEGHLALQIGTDSYGDTTLVKVFNRGQLKNSKVIMFYNEIFEQYDSQERLIRYENVYGDKKRIKLYQYLGNSELTVSYSIDLK